METSQSHIQDVTSSTTVPIAETFHSLQGEGLYTGTPMHFVRFAGCSVGKPQTGKGEPQVHLKTGKLAWECHTYDGRAFWCDTDFNKYKSMTIDQILEETYEEHLCITGGEPLLHPDVINHLVVRFKGLVHIETSGTIDIPFPYQRGRLWVTVSPKHGYKQTMIDRADEIKLLVDKYFDDTKAPTGKGLVYIQPINGEMYIDKYNVDMCVELLKKHPQWRLSMQLHKILGVR